MVGKIRAKARANYLRAVIRQGESLLELFHHASRQVACMYLHMPRSPRLSSQMLPAAMVVTVPSLVG